MSKAMPSGKVLASELAGRVTEQDWTEIVDALKTAAKSGNAAAARLLINARFGNKCWLSSRGVEMNPTSNRKARLLKILKPDSRNSNDDGTADRSETEGTSRPA